MDVLKRSEIIDHMMNKGVDISKNLRIRIVNHEDNPAAPEKICYKLYFTCKITNKRTRLALWPNTVGYQGF